MGIITIAKGLIAVNDMVPYVALIFRTVNNMLIDRQIAKIKSGEVSKDDQRAAILKAIAQANTNEQIIALSVSLHGLNNDIIMRGQSNSTGFLR